MCNHRFKNDQAKRRCSTRDLSSRVIFLVIRLLSDVTCRFVSTNNMSQNPYFVQRNHLSSLNDRSVLKSNFSKTLRYVFLGRRSYLKSMTTASRTNMRKGRYLTSDLSWRAIFLEIVFTQTLPVVLSRRTVFPEIRLFSDVTSPTNSLSRNSSSVRRN